jgi:hypothetical protein
MATQPPDSPRQQAPRHGWIDEAMLATILAALTAVFLGGIGIIVWSTAFDAEAVVAIVSPALAAVGTVAAGVFGYTLGARGSEEAQRTAGAATREAATVRQETATTAETAGSLATTVQRIHDQAMGGEPTASGKREISEDDLTTMLAAANQVAATVPRVSAKAVYRVAQP